MKIFKQLMTFTTARCSDEPGELLSLHANFMQITSLFYSGALYFVLKNCGKTRKTWIDRSIGQEWVAHRRHEFVHQVAAPSFRHTPLWGGGGEEKNMKNMFHSANLPRYTPTSVENVVIPCPLDGSVGGHFDLYPNVNLELCYDTERTFEINMRPFFVVPPIDTVTRS